MSIASFITLIECVTSRKTIVLITYTSMYTLEFDGKITSMVGVLSMMDDSGEQHMSMIVNKHFATMQTFIWTQSKTQKPVVSSSNYD